MTRSSSRERIVAVALDTLATAGTNASIEAVARAAGVTRQGVLYHFADKSELRAAMLSVVLARWEHEIAAEIGGRLDEAAIPERIRGYARVAARGDVVPGENALLAELMTRPDEAHPYAAWAQRWFAPSDADAGSARLTTAWLAAHSLWSALATGTRELSASEVAGVLTVIDELTA